MGRVRKTLSAIRRALGRRSSRLQPARRPERFHAELTIAQVRREHTGAQEVLARHHLGGCASCAVSEEETLRHGAALHQVDLDGLLADLEALPAAGER